jgi:hypothetical protein
MSVQLRRIDGEMAILRVTTYSASTANQFRESEPTLTHAEQYDEPLFRQSQQDFDRFRLGLEVFPTQIGLIVGLLLPNEYAKSRPQPARFIGGRNCRSSNQMPVPMIERQNWQPEDAQSFFRSASAGLPKPRS